MQLLNQTPLAARVDTSELAKGDPRIGVLSAKATFRFDLSEPVDLVTPEPSPLFMQDEPSPLGLIPHDFEPRRNRALEGILLGHAHVPHARPTETMRVALSVGSHPRELVVTGSAAG
jgi:hypothetical protein